LKRLFAGPTRLEQKRESLGGDLTVFVPGQRLQVQFRHYLAHLMLIPRGYCHLQLAPQLLGCFCGHFLLLPLAKLLSRMTLWFV